MSIELREIFRDGFVYGIQVTTYLAAFVLGVGLVTTAVAGLFKAAALLLNLIGR